MDRLVLFWERLHGCCSIGGKAGPKSDEVTLTELGKPVGLLPPKEVEVSQRRQWSNGLRADDGGESECRAVMARIGVETSSHAKAGRLP